MTEPTRVTEPFETRRWNADKVQVFAAMDTMPQIAERVRAIVGEGRTMNKIATYVQSGGLADLSRLDHATGLHTGGHESYPDGHTTWHKDDDQSGFMVYLTHGYTHGTLDGFGAGVLAYNAATEKQVRDRYNKAKISDSSWDSRKNITLLTINGRPNNPNRTDRIEVMDWNDDGVLRHTIITFVEHDYCDSGRIEEIHHVLVGHRKDPNLKPYAPRDEDPEVFARYTDPHTDLDAARAEARKINSQPDIDYVRLAEEKITRERRSI